MVASPNDFVDVVARARGLVVATAAGGHAFRLQPRGDSPAWHCDLDDGTPTGESDPASFVRWVCPALRTAGRPTASVVPLLDVDRTGFRSDLDRIVSWFGRLAGRPLATGVENLHIYTDPHEILDAPLRDRIEHWPAAMHGDGVVRPAELLSIRTKLEGLVVTSVSWWGSAPALDHQIALAVDIAARLDAHRRHVAGEDPPPVSP